MTEPRTEAGRALLARVGFHWQLCRVNVGDGACTIDEPFCDLPGAILAIEDEAAAGVAELEAALRDVLDFHKLDDPECASCWTAHALLDTRSPESKCRRRAGPATEAPVNEEAPDRPQPGLDAA